VQNANDFNAVSKRPVENQIVFELFDAPLAKVWHFSGKVWARASYQRHRRKTFKRRLGGVKKRVGFFESVNLFDEVRFFNQVNAGKGRLMTLTGFYSLLSLPRAASLLFVSHANRPPSLA